MPIYGYIGYKRTFTENGYGIMGNLAIPGPLVKPLPRQVQIYADIWIYWL